MSLDQVRRLLARALDEFDDPSTSVAATVRRALRIATIRSDAGAQLWLHSELSDLPSSKLHDWIDPKFTSTRAELDSFVGKDEGERVAEDAFSKWQRNRYVEGKGLYAASVGQLEEKLRFSNSVLDNFAAPSPGSPSDSSAHQSVLNGRAALLLNALELTAILDRIRSSVHSFLVDAEASMNRGEVRADVFSRAQRYVNSTLERLAPKAHVQFISAQERLEGGGPEDLALALTSCRRMIKSLADYVYPASGERLEGPDGVGRTMSDDQYRNRILQFVSQTVGKHGQGPVVRSTVDGLGARLKALDSLASKGVHDDVTAAEADTCVVWTYMLAADILRLVDGSSALLSPQRV